ncbi:hypothetical protein NQ318_008014 [Aromia moschata]|uniref:Reverse transcriptase domain-containing protein n=1 Tax=Aromia moschata TaxID=1265417 RepID=A0AAV8XV87_9CUCU|nr:hypothetical protein NQ318_008014 [Aromia moschata]
MVIDIVREKLISIGITKRMATNLVSMYINRKVYIKMNDVMIGPRVTSLGLPQGSILSPLLYIIYSSDFNSHLEQSIRTIQFADDICIYIETTSISQGHSKLSQAMEVIHNWCNKNGLPIAENKSSFLSDKMVTRLNAKNSQCMTQLHKLTIQVLTLPYWHNKKTPLLVESYTRIA